MKQSKNILVCPLDWGLGHATRMVPVIEMLKRKGANAIIAADKRPLEFLKQSFPECTFIKLEGYSPIYSSNNSMALAMLRSFPKILRAATNAKKELQEIIKIHNIQAVISDNRYELSTSKVPSVFITHQLNIQTVGWQIIVKPFIDMVINNYINKFDEVWIPDLTGDFQLSGKLSNTNKLSSKLFKIGLISRFSDDKVRKKPKTVNILILLSGPEPQRTILEEMLLAEALKTKLKIVMLLGKPDENINRDINNVKLISHLPDEEFASLIQASDFIISRPGYSTLMDLSNFGCKAVFIPTPGQTEQEYLAKRLLDKGIAFSKTQNSFNLAEAIANQGNYAGLLINNNSDLLEERIDNLLNIC